MTDKTEAQPEALRLADDRPYSLDDDLYAWSQSAEQMIRDQHAEIQQLKAQLSARQAAPDGWRLVPVEPTQAMCDAAKYTVHAGLSVFKWADGYHAMLSAAPPPPEREPLSETEVRGLLESAGYWPGEDAQRADFINGLRYCEMAHGIGATND